MTQYRFGGAGSWYITKYDALGRVRERDDLTPTTTKYYSDGRQLVQQLDASDTVEFDYLRGPTGLDRQYEVSGTKKRMYIKDPLGTVWAMVDPSNLSVKHYNYNAWGEHLDKDDTDFPTDTNYLRYISSRVEAFGDSTAQTDAIYHLDHRHYLPVLGMFLQREPLSFRNLKRTTRGMYSYASNAPTFLSDPSGLACAPPTPCTGGEIEEIKCWLCICPESHMQGPCTIPIGSEIPLDCHCQTMFEVQCEDMCPGWSYKPSPDDGEDWILPFPNPDPDEDEGSDSGGSSTGAHVGQERGEGEPAERHRCPSPPWYGAIWCTFPMPYIGEASIEDCTYRYMLCISMAGGNPFAGYCCQKHLNACLMCII